MRFTHRLRFASLYAFICFSLILTLSRSGRGEDEGQRRASGFTYQLALPGRKITFPEDHYSHPNFKTEWWYYTGHLESERGKRYGYQVTFFRFGLRDRQNEAKEKPQFSELYMAHFALSDINAKEFRYRERINRGYNGKAGAATDRYLVWNEDWKVEGDHNDHKIRVNDRGTELQLNLKSLKPPVLHGSKGLSQKAAGEGRASYYYSLTRMQTEGVLKVDGKAERVRGLSWMDHEFGSNQLGQDQVGWDWFSIQLDDQTECMLYLMRRKDGSVDPYSSGTLVSANGSTRHLDGRQREGRKSDRCGRRCRRAQQRIRFTRAHRGGDARRGLLVLLRAVQLARGLRRGARRHPGRRGHPADSRRISTFRRHAGGGRRNSARPR